ncbi:MAG: ribonuclease Z [Acidobacteriota bacterium]
MKLTILGSGTLIPNGKKNSAGFFVETSNARIMLDCGAGTLHALARFGVEWQSLTHLFLSHFHVDHIGELASLFFALRYGLSRERQQPLMLIAPQGIDRILECLKQAFGEKIFNPPFPFQQRVVAAGDTLQIADDCHLTFAKTPHTDESLAIKIISEGKTLGYTGDTDFSESLMRFFHHTDLLISECAYLEPQAGKKHLSITDLGKLAMGSEVNQLVITHTYFNLPEAEIQQRLGAIFTGEIIIGSDGLSLEV